MRKAIMLVALVSFLAVVLSGCAVVIGPTFGTLYTDLKAPAGVGDQDVKAAKIGKATASSILGWIATGDASIDAAMKAGGITKIHHVDYEAKSILGLYATYTTVVYGE